jgi:hypothetical protein
VTILLGAMAVGARAQETAKPYQLTGHWIEGCACSIPCGCVINGKAASGCEGVAVLSVRTGHYGSVNLAGTKVAVGLQPGDWAIVYFDPTSTPAQQTALSAILEPQVKALGVKVEATRTAPITITGANGRFTVTIPEVMTLQTEPVTGLNKARPIEYHNLPDPFLRDCYQARSVSGSYKDGDHQFTLQDTNAFWANVRVKS